MTKNNRNPRLSKYCFSLFSPKTLLMTQTLDFSQANIISFLSFYLLREDQFYNTGFGQKLMPQKGKTHDLTNLNTGPLVDQTNILITDIELRGLSVAISTYLIYPKQLLCCLITAQNAPILNQRISPH